MKALKNMFRKGLILASCLLVCGSLSAQPQVVGLERAAQAKEAHVNELLAMQGVVGVGVGVDEMNQAAVHISVAEPGALARLPRVLDGVPVVAQVTGKIFALGALPNAARGKAASTKPTSYFSRPVPIGVSTGNELECSAGTIGCRVKDGTALYALSNNHVYARENAADFGEEVAQPGRYDTGCLTDAKYDLGALSDYVKIDFSKGAVNLVDAAIATVGGGDLGQATPSNGYGTPKSAIGSASVNQLVQKYGRTTGLTKGTVTAVNYTLSVNYGNSGVAVFQNQILVQSGKPFIKAGDSGSLLVTDDRTPVGLLFAGDVTGKAAFANQIGDVLNELKVTIDGAP